MADVAESGTPQAAPPRARIVGWLAGEATHGTIWKAGLPKTMRKEPAHA